MTKLEKLEKLLEMLGITFDDVREFNANQIKALELQYKLQYGERIDISFVL